jgi:RNA-directed DNA polymerase
MLATLEKGVIGGKWYSLIDKLYPETTLRTAFAAVKANKGAAGVDHVSIADYAETLDANLARLSEALRTGTYWPQAIRRHYIPKPGSQEMRPLGIPTIQDRVVQTALRMEIEPIFERDIAQHSYGFRPNRGCKDALRRVDELLKAGYVHVVDADLKSYFDTIPKDRLLAWWLARRPVAASCWPWSGPFWTRVCWRTPASGLPNRAHHPGGGDQSAAEQHLPGPAGPSDGGTGL